MVGWGRRTVNRKKNGKFPFADTWQHREVKPPKQQHIQKLPSVSVRFWGGFERNCLPVEPLRTDMGGFTNDGRRGLLDAHCTQCLPPRFGAHDAESIGNFGSLGRDLHKRTTRCHLNRKNTVAIARNRLPAGSSSTWSTYQSDVVFNILLFVWKTFHVHEQHGSYGNGFIFYFIFFVEKRERLLSSFFVESMWFCRYGWLPDLSADF